jgi:hypothetical protein
MGTEMLIVAILIILSVVALFIAYMLENTLFVSLSSIALVTFINIFIKLLTPSVPSAIDVYRNYTDLKVTYEICNGDTLSCDSTVVFKQKTI